MINKDLIFVDDNKIKEVANSYFLWKKLDTNIRELFQTRGLNLPSEISEAIVCYVLKYYINKGSSGDAIDKIDDDTFRVIEIKGSSSKNINAPNSFSPTEVFDELVFIRLEKDEDIFKIYKTGLSSNNIKQIKVNKEQTFEDQQKEGRRPRFSIQRQIIEKYNLEPDYIFNVKDYKD